MAGNLGRDDLIKALGSAFAKPEEDDAQKKSSSKVVAAVAGDKHVLRLITNYENPSQKRLYLEQPDVVFVNKLVDEMAASKQANIEIVSRDLIVKFNKAVEDNNDPKVLEIIKVCKSHYLRLQSVGLGSPERALVFMSVIDAIKKM